MTIVVLGVVALLLAGALTLRLRTFCALAVFLLAFLNVVNYSPFGWLASGIRVGHARLPILLLALGWLLASRGGRMAAVALRNGDVTAFAAWAVICSIDAAYPEPALLYSAWLACCVVLMMGMLDLLAPGGDAVAVTARVFVAAYLFPLALGLVNLPAYLAGAGRLAAALDVDQIHAWAAAVIIGAVLALSQLPAGRRTAAGRLFSTAGALLLALALVDLLLSGTRSALIAATATGIVYALANWRRSNNLMRLVLVAVVGLVVARSAIGTTTMQRYTRFFVERELTTGDAVRVKLLNAHLDFALRKPVFGGGLISAAQEVGEENWELQGLSPHNSYVGLLSATGFVGAFLFLTIAFRSTVVLFRERALRPHRSAIMLLMVPPLVMSLFEWNITPGQALFFPFWLALLLPRFASPPAPAPAPYAAPATPPGARHEPVPTHA